MVVWLSGKNDITISCDVHWACGSNLACAFIFYIIITAVITAFHQNSNRIQQNTLGSEWNVHSIGIPWNLDGIPMDSDGNHSGRLPDSDHFHQIPWDSIRISTELETKMTEAPANWFPSEFCGIPTFCSKSAGFHGNLWRRVKTSLFNMFQMGNGFAWTAKTTLGHLWRLEIRKNWWTLSSLTLFCLNDTICL